MVTKRSEKKTWVVRQYVDDDEGLEKELNQLADDGYTLYEIQHERNRLIAYTRSEPSLLKIFDGPLSDLLKDKDTEDGGNKTMGVTKDPLESFQFSTPAGERLADDLTPVMSSHSNGDLHTEIKVKKIVERYLKRLSLHEIQTIRQDLTRALELHKEYSKKHAGHGDSCSVEVVVQIAINKIDGYLEHNLPS